MNADELNVWLQRVSNGTSHPLESVDEEGTQERNWSTLVAQMQRWMERNDGRLPPLDTPQPDLVMYHATFINEKLKLEEKYRKVLAVGENTFYRKMIARGTAKSLPYDVANRCRWNLESRWDVPRVITADPPLAGMTREGRRQEKKEDKERRKAAEDAMAERRTRSKRRRSDQDSGNDEEERSNAYSEALQALEDQQAAEFIDPEREMYDPVIQVLHERESSMQQGEPKSPILLSLD